MQLTSVVTGRNPVIRFLLQRAGRIYTAGPTVEDARRICDRLGAGGIASTVGYWDGFTDSPVSVAASYLCAIDVARSLRSDCYLSIKAPAFNFDTDLLGHIVREASRTNIIVHFDSMAPETVAPTFTLIEQARRIYPNIGCTLPGRWHRSLRDADRAVDLGLRVRVVKGQWSGLDGDEINPHEGFLRVVDRLAAAGAQHVAVATHNAAVAHDALRRLKTAAIPCELELLHSLPQQPLRKIARDLNVPVRVYVPFGQPALPYRLKELHRDPRIAVWFLRDLFRSALAAKSQLRRLHQP